MKNLGPFYTGEKTVLPVQNELLHLKPLGVADLAVSAGVHQVVHHAVIHLLNRQNILAHEQLLRNTDHTVAAILVDNKKPIQCGAGERLVALHLRP